MLPFSQSENRLQNKGKTADGPAGGVHMTVLRVARGKHPGQGGCVNTVPVA
jgi:hypothetical protein